MCNPHAKMTACGHGTTVTRVIYSGTPSETQVLAGISGGAARVNTVVREWRVAHHGASVRQIWSWLSALSSRRLHPSAPHGVRSGLSA